MKFDKEFFNITATLDCGQIFRYIAYKKGYLVFSLDKCAYCWEDSDKVIIECQNEDANYFYNFFDLDRDYRSIYNFALSEKVEILTRSASVGKGIRILNQNATESLFSFIVSQNNNIPRIKGIIEKLCTAIGEKREFNGYTYYSFPTAKKMASMDKAFYQSIGLGYRAEYIRRLAVEIVNGLNIESFKELNTQELRKRLVSIYGVGPKVADCVTLFGFHKSDTFPVDTWIEKVYKEDFNGNLSDRKKISDYLVKRFGENAGYFQQYLFYFKRSIEKTYQNTEK